jgi:bifunctional DNase/RNase
VSDEAVAVDAPARAPEAPTPETPVPAAEPVAAPAEPVDGEPVTEEPLPPPDCRLSFAGVEVELPDTNPTVILQEADPPYRQLRIPIGSPEGVAIAYAWRGIATPRPLTHELFADVMRAFGIVLEVVRITEVRGASFAAELVLSGIAGSRTVPCRPSDGIALALRQGLGVPIMAAAAVMDEAAT